MLSLIVAFSENNIIGNDNKLPWHIPEDLKYFKETTEGKILIMGRITYESLPESVRPLPNRTTYVLTRNKDYVVDHPDVRIFNDVEKCLMMATLASKQGEVIVCGGEKIYRLMMPYADRIYATIVSKLIEGDTYFPTIDFSEWKASHDAVYVSEQLELFYTRIIYDRIKKTPRRASK